TVTSTGRELPFSDAESFLNDVLESSTEYSIIAADDTGKILLWNEGARRSYGYTPEQIVGKDARILDPVEGTPSGKVDAVLQMAVARGKWEGVLRRRRKSGEEFPARVFCTLLKSRSGTPMGFLLVSKDITEEERLHQKLVESEEYI